MLKLSQNDITLNLNYNDKFKAIDALAEQLQSRGFVASGYVEGMQERESQNSTYLGNGIAIPHGTTQTRDLVIQTGVTIQQFPQGIDWGDGNTVYLAIGIAAKSDEHLEILKQLTKVLSADGVEHTLKHAKDEQTILNLLNGDSSTTGEIMDGDLIQLGFPATQWIQIVATAGGLLKNKGAVENSFISNIMDKRPTHLGKGLWLVTSNEGVIQTKCALVTTSEPCTFDSKHVSGLLAIAACDHSHTQLLSALTDLVQSNRQEEFMLGDKEKILSFVSSNETPSNAQEINELDTIKATFRIRNAHGLHARPGAMLVAEAKKFDSAITVSNITSDGNHFVNAKSLMKVIALGVKQGHELEFIASGNDAEQAISAIGQAINSGLGEG